MLLTLHRATNVESRDRLAELLDAAVEGAGDLPVIFPLHPRTRARIDAFGLRDRFAGPRRGLHATGPLGYLDCIKLTRHARIVLTDSGGLQEETSVLGVPCVTLRENTERPITLTEGTNRLGGVRRETLLSAIAEALGAPRKPRRPPLWDGRAAERIVDVIAARA